MPRILKLAALAALFAISALLSPANAQDTSAYKVAPCVTAVGPDAGKNGIPYCAPVTTSTPLPVTMSGGGGGGGPVTLAAGAVAAGAYSAGSYVSGAILSGAFADGAITTLGTKADTAWTSGPGTEISILKAIAGNTGAITGSVTISNPVGPTSTDAASVAVTCNSTGTLCGILEAPPNVSVNGANQPLTGITQGTGQTGAVTALNVVNTPSNSTTIGITPIVSASGESSHVLKAGAGNLYSAYATNLTTTAGFLVILNATSAPGDGAITPLACAPLAPNGVASLNYAPGPPGIFSTGITAVVSSAATCFTKTTGTITAFISGSVQ